jgi:lipid A 3-O-deacylase
MSFPRLLLPALAGLLSLAVFPALPLAAQQEPAGAQASRLPAPDGATPERPGWAPVEVALELGRSRILDRNKGIEAGGEIRFAPRRLRWQPHWFPSLSPMAGGMATGRGTIYGYAGFGIDLNLGLGWVLRPNWAAGLFYQRRDRDLGGPIEFRSALELTRGIGPKARLGLAFYHLSNGGIHDYNPGIESLILTFAVRP